VNTRMQDCIFCKIISGNIPSEKTEYENGSIVSFPDIKPKTPGHTLVLPVAHARWFDEMNEKDFATLMRVAHRIARKLKKERGADYIQVGIVGKDVPHVHVHLVPRMLSDSSMVPL